MTATYFVTGATGQLGQIVIDSILRSIPAADIVAGARTPGGPAGQALAAKGVAVRAFDYEQPENLGPALAGVERLLLISSNAIGARTAQHAHVVAAAKAAGVAFVAYTSLLHADSSPLALAAEHRETERMLEASGLAYALLRNGWYTENYTATIAPALAHGAFIGAAGAGRISSAARADFADAAAAALIGAKSGVYELAGDESYTLAEFADAIAEAAGKPVVYRDLGKAGFKAALLAAGLPEPVAGLLSDADADAADGALFDESRQLSALIGRRTTPWRQTVAQSVAALARG